MRRKPPFRGRGELGVTRLYPVSRRVTSRPHAPGWLEDYIADDFPVADTDVTLPTVRNRKTQLN